MSRLNGKYNVTMKASQFKCIPTLLKVQSTNSTICLLTVYNLSLDPSWRILNLQLALNQLQLHHGCSWLVQSTSCSCCMRMLQCACKNCLHCPHSFLQSQFQVPPTPGQPSRTQGCKQISSPHKSPSKLWYQHLDHGLLPLLAVAGQPHQVSVTIKLCTGQDDCGHSSAVENVHHCKSIFFRLYFLASQQLSLKLIRQADIC